MQVEWTSYNSPIGMLTVVECEAGPLAVEFPHRAMTIKWAVRLRAAVPELHIAQGTCRITSTEEQKGEAAAIEEGLERAFRRLDMTFESPEAYLDFWFPDRGLTLDDLPLDLADYYLYDLEKVEGGYRPKASRAAAEEDSRSVSSEAPTLEELHNVSCPVALVRASQGFFPGSDPLVSDDTRDAIAGVLDLRSDALVEGATHYTMLWPEYTRAWANKDFDPPFWER